MMNKYQHVRTQLESVGGRVGLTYRGGDAWIRCPFHAGGNERTPSCKVCVDPARGPAGSYVCFGCRETPPSGVVRWDWLANALHVVPFRPSQMTHDMELFSFSNKSDALSDAEVKQDGGAPKLRLDGLLGWPDNPWRTIDAATMQALDARVLYYHNELSAYFPVHVNRNYVGGVYARIEITDEDKERGILAYINTNGPWANDALFGYNLARTRRGPLWCVEGPRDTAKTFQLTGRGVGLLSAHVSEKKCTLIEALDPPCLIIATDPDASGERGRAKLIERFEHSIPCYEVNFPPGKDPAKMNRRVYERILQKIGLANGIPERTLHYARPTGATQFAADRTTG